MGQHLVLRLLGGIGVTIEAVFDPGQLQRTLQPRVLGLLACQCQIRNFQGGHAMRRYIAGAVLMGFGGMLAGGCAVGSVSNSAVFATTAWVALFAMWLGAMLTDALIDWPSERQMTLRDALVASAVSSRRTQS